MMNFSSSVLSSLIFILVGVATTVAAKACTIEEVNLDVDQRNNFQTGVKIDIYQCSENAVASPPLIVFGCGGAVPKSAYGTFAAGLSTKGYTVAVIEHLVQFGPQSPALNFGTPVDVQNTINYAEANLDVDTSTIILMGHSYGGGVMLLSLNEQCIFPFCDNEFVSLHPGVVLTATFGFSLRNEMGEFSELQNEVDIPFGIINGAGDINSFEDIAGENLTQGSFDRLLPTKIVATIDNLDHFSISEVITNPDRGDIFSTLPLNEQIDTVIDAMSFFVKKMLKKNVPETFCQQFEERADDEGYVVTDCLEAY